MSNKKLSVLMVTGVYYPEVNGATLQCMRVISTLKKDVNFSVLTTTKDKNIAKNNVIDGIDVYRHYIGNRLGKFSQLFGISWIFFTKKIDIVHLHGFSSRSALIVLISKIFNKKVIIKMTSFGHDDAISIRNKGRLFFYIFSLADFCIGVSPIFNRMYLKSGLSKCKYHQIPNGVNTNFFKPLLDSDKDRSKLRTELGLPVNMKLILVVGHFSVEKSMDHVLDAWLNLQKFSNCQSGLVFIGNTDSNAFEVDNNLVRLMRTKASPFLGKNIFFIEKSNNIEKYYQTSDIYVLPSSREGLPNTLLEAMSCALPVISTKLDGITDWIIKHEVNGILYDHGDISTLTLFLSGLLQDKNLSTSLGIKARKTIKVDFDISSTADRIYNFYKGL